jgi:hypothetical protein
MSLIAQPQWIAKMYPPKVGLDHLGLGKQEDAHANSRGT